MSSPPDTISPTSSLAHLPGDLLIEIATWLHTRSDILYFTQTSNRIFKSVIPLLYDTVVLVDAEQCAETLGMLFRRPETARHVRKLVVRVGPNGSIVSSIIRKVAVRFDALNSFEWDGHEMPDEDIWFALRLLCPRLRRISTTIGSILPKQNSHLFDFVDLLGFSLVLKPSFYYNHLRDVKSPMCHGLWDMLDKHCPNLEELSIEASIPEPINAHFLAHARWKNLRKFNVGNLQIDTQADVSSLTNKAPFVMFLEAHSKLQSLKLSRHNIHPSHFSCLGPETLPHITEFGGTLEQLRQLPYIHSRLKSVVFQDPIPSRPIAAVTILQDLPALVHLTVSFALQTTCDGDIFLRSLFTTCPRLECLELTCTGVPSFQLGSFSKAIRKFTRLCHLTLAFVQFPCDETLSAGAIRIARANPRLSTINLINLPSSQPLPLAFFFPFLSFVFTKVTGNYQVVCDEHGLPNRLVAHEQRCFVWPFGLGVWRSSKKKRILDLRPVGYPGREQRGVMGLLLEKSASGDEMRMILFYLLLVFLAVWGFMRHGNGSSI